MFAQRLALVSMTRGPTPDLQDGRLWGQLTGLLWLMPVFWLLESFPGWTPSQPTHPFLRHRDRKPRWTPDGQTHAYPLLHTSSLSTEEPFTECSTPPVVWEGCAVCAFGEPACRLKCARWLCLCVLKCEITPAGVLNRREEGQPDVLAMGHSSKPAHLE